ncbi:ompH [Acrasis kona]|uniref:OmpH n=1 Tax=Acrasis kona TaxID=1008807 RepID=A0AAW2Z7W5_9EUKA
MSLVNNIAQGAVGGAQYGAVNAGINSVMSRGKRSGGFRNNMKTGAKYGAMNAGLNTAQNKILGQPRGFVDRGVRDGVNWSIQQRVMGGRPNVKDNITRGVAMGAIGKVLPRTRGKGIVGHVENQVRWNLQNKAYDGIKRRITKK